MLPKMIAVTGCWREASGTGRFLRNRPSGACPVWQAPPAVPAMSVHHHSRGPKSLLFRASGTMLYAHDPLSAESCVRR